MRTSSSHDSVKPQYVSVVLSGGISLGAYHAGAVAQVGWFLSEWNKLCDEDKSLPRIFVDVVSGASAGAMTGAMLAHFIGSDYYATYPNQSKFAGLTKEEFFVKQNFDTWCGEKLSILNLLEGEDAADRTSVLSNSVLQKLAEEAMPHVEPALPKGQGKLIYTCK